MNKTLSISLAGFSFIIEDNAYTKLNEYLNALRSSLDANEEGEVMQDIESRIAEVFQESLGKREVVNEADIQKIIDLIGSPEKIEEQEEAYYSESNRTSKADISEKQLFRDPENGMIGGVTSGLAHYFGVDKIWIRLIFAFLALAKLSGVLIYIILWIIIPKAKTASDFLKMRGKPANFDNIKEQSNKIVEFANDSSKKISNAYYSNKKNIDNTGNKIWNIFRKILGIFMLFIGISLFISSLVALSISSFTHVNFFDNVGFYFQENNLSYVVVALVFLSTFLPSVICSVIGVKLLSPKTKLNYIGYVIGGLSIIWISLCIFTGIFTIKKGEMYYGNNEEIEKIAIKTSSDSLYIDLKKVNIGENFNSYWGHIYSDKKTIFKKEHLDVDVIRENISQPYLKIIKNANGYNQPLRVNVPIDILDNKIFIPNYISYPYKYRFRDYDVDYTLVIPYSMKVFSENSKIYLDEDEFDDNKRYDIEYNRKHENNPPKNNLKEGDSIIINGRKEAVKTQ